MAAGERTKFHYFAYGSNMLREWLIKRCPSARPLGVAQLHGYELRWHKSSKDGSGKCDIVPNSNHAVFGVLYEIDEIERTRLDRAEGCGHGYERTNVEVKFNEGEVIASTYVATNIDQSLKPYTWYKALVVAGARQHRLPVRYISTLEAVEALEDSDRDRHTDSMRIVSAANHSDEAQA